MSAFDPLRSLEVPAILLKMSTSDPFFIPDRTAEAVSFVSAAMFGLTAPIALAVVPLRPANLVIILALTLFALLSLMRGMAARRHRLGRERRANELRASLLESTGEPASN